MLELVRGLGRGFVVGMFCQFLKSAEFIGGGELGRQDNFNAFRIFECRRGLAD